MSDEVKKWIWNNLFTLLTIIGLAIGLYYEVQHMKADLDSLNTKYDKLIDLLILEQHGLQPKE